MADDVKSLTKKYADLEKRLKLAEAKIKSLADSMTDPKRIEKFLAVVSGAQTDLAKKTKRELELQDKAFEARRKEDKRERDRQDDQRNKEYVKYREHSELIRRIENLEQMVQLALARR